MYFPIQVVALLLLATTHGVLGWGNDNDHGCKDDNCARAVTGTRFPPAVQSSHKADCSSFLRTTVTPATKTVTVTVTAPPHWPPDHDPRALEARQVTVIPTAVPAYASACSGTARYSSACSCFKVTGVTTTAPTPTKTITVTVTPKPTACPTGSARCNRFGKCQDLRNDRENCGKCGHECESGVCENGVCTTKACKGSKCGHLKKCDKNCFCFETSEDTGFCGPGTLCAPLPSCHTSRDCALGTVCATSTCCGRKVCLGPGGCEKGEGHIHRSLESRDPGEMWTNGAVPDAS